MELDEAKISKAIIDSYHKKLTKILDADVAIAGAGPAGLTAAYYLAKKGIKVVVFEKKLSPGGGMWGGGMLFNEIVVQEDGKKMLDEFGIKYEKYSEHYYTADSVETISTICSKAVKAGALLFNCISVEDVILKQGKIHGLVINWTPVDMAKLHVDPLAIKSKYVIEATGHPLEVLTVIEKKCGGKMFTETGKIIWEKSMDATQGEKDCVEYTKEVFPNVFVAGMAANAAFGRPRMGPIFGGMLLSGKKVAEMLIERLKGKE
ncbi:sulfide-dependent adenosine diphosphate thiazole synthase [Candidatus Woesearchaeota archaeon]|nr:sulfide-dependent adenosine diphosphate thiazole synthase [Candidatus Woesearchaeota archaeon]